MQVGDLVYWVDDKDVIGIIVNKWDGYFGDEGWWVLLMDGRKELFDQEQLEIV